MKKYLCIPFYSKLPSSKFSITFINNFYRESDQYIVKKRKIYQENGPWAQTKRNNWGEAETSHIQYQTLGCLSSTYTIFKEIKALLKDLQRTKKCTEKKNLNWASMNEKYT